ncbi:chitin synthase III catalytic subunit [Syncephalis pseudoplumigaleata]|uniref:Chitin synthase export chaperone n=1 Tax=Syncephalis pseudoplumigaleata TaxID=1712513 RepID=A0A4P9Z362_9FUNG|nr:chitin synthase III catalytic subunit [Syncephalis pseudoplumigaleata]RKP26412.1 chitin synthase III catalytic subunit [Syncephalis pseudoplumigaleata]|eukprot:RKP26408.1 chitin synthase III catalytic subunit [Syncephalis pseudoplumigaleata]
MRFGSFADMCHTASLMVCPMLGRKGGTGLETDCYPRNVDIGGVLIFQSATLIIHIVALVMTSIMIYHIRSKYTAVGEWLMHTMLAMPCHYFTAIHVGLMCATFWCLLLNGFVGFQFAEDGTPLSLWSIRISSLVIAVITAFIAIGTFQGIAGLDPQNPIALWIVYFIFNGAAFAIYVILQVVLVINTLDDRWPLGDILFGLFFFVVGQVLSLGFSNNLCKATKHYIDGVFFGAICTLLSVMMVYKYWDSITKEDLEFSVGGKQNTWEVKDAYADDEFAYGAPPTYGGSPADPYGYPKTASAYYDDRY